MKNRTAGKFWGRGVAVMLLAMALCAIAQSPCAAREPILPLKDVKPGMKGVGRTVFKGTAITQFPVVVLGVLPGAGPGGSNMILIRVGGADMKNNGGVAMGMSGSPVYIGGKLIGALSIAFPDTDHSLAGVTPIEDMYNEINYLDAPADAKLPKPLKINGKTYDTVSFARARKGEPGVLSARTAVAPIAIRGVNKRTYAALKTFFASSGTDVLPFIGSTAAATVATPAKTEKAGALKPGSSVAVQLTRGDIDISAVGTLTTLDGNKVLIFGHQFFTKGKVEYLLSDASVITIVSDMEAPYKLSSSGAKRGVIYQDRGKALAGYVGKFPEMIPVKISVEDGDIKSKKEYSVEIAPDQDLVPNLVAAVMLGALDKSIDRIGPGTAEIQFKVMTKGLDTKIERTNTFYSGYDITAESMSELMAALEMLRSNSYKEVAIAGVEASVIVNSKKTSASIVEASITDPGEKDKEKKDEQKEKTESKSAAPATEDKEATNDSGIASGSGEDVDDSNSDDSVSEDDEQIVGEDIADDEDAGPDETADEDKGGDDAKGSASGLAAANTGNPHGRRDRQTSGRKRTSKLKKVYPGQKLCLKISLLPYRKDNVEEMLYIKVPKDIASGTAVIDIYSGMKYQRSMGGLEDIISAISDQQKAPREGGSEGTGGGGKKPKKKTLEDIIKNFLDHDKNNELVATITSLSAAPKDDEADADEAPAKQDDGDQGSEILTDEDEFEPPSKDRAKKTTPFVITGSTSIRVRVEDSGGKAPVTSGRIRKSKISTLKDNTGEKDGGKSEGKK